MAYPIQSILDGAMSGVFVDAGHIQMRTTHSLLGAIKARRQVITVADARSDVPVPPIDQVVVDVACDLLAPLGLLKDVLTDRVDDTSEEFYTDHARTEWTSAAVRPGEVAPVVTHLLLTAAYLRSDEALYAQLQLSSAVTSVLLSTLLKTMLQDGWVVPMIERGLAALLVDFAPLGNASDSKGKARETVEQCEAEHGLATLASLIRRIGRGGELRGPWGDWVRKQVESVICDPANGASGFKSALMLRPPADLLILVCSPQTSSWSRRCSPSARRSRPFSEARSRCLRRPSLASGTRTSSCATQARVPSRLAWAAGKISRPR